MTAAPQTQPATLDAEAIPPEPVPGGVYLRPCNPVPGAALAFDLVDVLFRGTPARRRVRLQHAMLHRWAEKNAPGAAHEIARLGARLGAPRGPLCGLALDRPRLMGVLNVTPDSFSDGGLHHDRDAAVAHALEMVEQGADIIDIGGESTRPGAERVTEEEQMQRVIPVIRELQQQLPAHVPISIDTTSTRVAGAALQQGATIINDVSAGRDDPGMLKLVAEAGVPYIIMHMQGSPRTMQDNPHYDDVVAEIRTFLLARAEAAMEAGIKQENLVLDPGIGFGKSKRDNLDIIVNLDSFTATGYKVLLGASRKRFMGSICDITSFNELVGATCATTTIGVFAGVHILRVHDIKENRQALDVAWALLERKRGQI